jgi:UDP-N-acetylglucosamine 2-epimerase (non-hydrolysing)
MTRKTPNILICFGTRPEWLKVKPLINKLNCKLLFTGQHQDLLKSVRFDYHIEPKSKSSRLNAIIEDCLSQFPDTTSFDYVLVQGDTATAFACAVAAFNTKTKIIHLESGLRTYDLSNPYPEEGYRQMISRIADINFCPTELSLKNLKNEKVNNLHLVGNTSLDNLKHLKNKSVYKNKILVTLHRRENHDYIKDWFSQIEELANKYTTFEFILPIHPNPNVLKHKTILRKVKAIEPLDHDDLIKILLECAFCITDSGGIQEEATFLNKKCIVCRSSTERSEGIDSGHIILCKNPNELSEKFYNLTTNYKIDSYCPFGDGNSSDLIKEILYKINYE